MTDRIRITMRMGGREVRHIEWIGTDRFRELCLSRKRLERRDAPGKLGLYDPLPETLYLLESREFGIGALTMR